MNENILVSIVVPVYNVEQYVERCVNTIMNQSHKNLEIILVDDGSQDGSPRICDELAERDKRIVVIHQENKGLGMARNTGLDVFKGQWLSFVDSDDFIHENYVETLLDIALKNDCLMSTCYFRRGLDDEFPVSFPGEVKIFDDVRHYVYSWQNSGTINGWGSIFHYSILKNFRFSSIRILEDIASMHNLVYAAKSKKYAITKQCMYYYYHTPQSLMRGVKNSNYFLCKDALLECIEFWQKKGEKEILELCWQQYYSRLVQVVIETSRDIPQYKEKISEITELVKNGFPRAISYGNGALNLSVGAPKTYADLVNPQKKYILYGFGKNGSELLLWLKYFKINVLEIFDRRANNTETALDIPLKQAHDGLAGEDTVVIISIGERETRMEVRHMLREMGYNNFIEYGSVNMALRYAAYKKFLPFLLES